MIDSNSQTMLIRDIEKALYFVDVEPKLSEIITSGDMLTKYEYMDYKLYPKKLNDAPLYVLYWFIKCLQSVNSVKYRINTYFTPIEITEYALFRREKENLNDLLVFNDAYQLSKNQWTLRMSVKQIALLRKNGLIRADANFQRNSKAVSDGILRRIHVNWRRVDAICESIVNGSYSYNTIRLNVINDGVGKFKFDPESHTITVDSSCDIIVPDGNHRCLAAEKAFFLNYDLKEYFETQYFQIAFTFFTPEEVKKCISQEWNTEPVNKHHKESMKVSNSNTIIDEIIRSEKAENIYSKAIVSTGVEIKAKQGFILYEDLKNAISTFYSPDNYKLKKQVIETSEWIIQYLNFVCENIIDEISDTNKKNWTKTTLAWCGFIKMSKIFQNRDDWKAATLNVLSNINWNDDKYLIKGAKVKDVYELIGGLI